VIDAKNLFHERPKCSSMTSALQRRAFSEAQVRKIVAGENCVGMLGAERLLVDRERPLVERPRAGEVALGLKQLGEVVEARGGPGMLGAERLLADRQRPLEERPRAGEVAWALSRRPRLLRLDSLHDLCTAPTSVESGRSAEAASG
jgi:hypothetical protein